MFRKYFVPILVASVGVPYAASTAGIRDAVTRFTQSTSSSSSTSDTEKRLSQLLPKETASPATPAATKVSAATTKPASQAAAATTTASAIEPATLPPLAGASTNTLGDVLNLDVTKAWVLGRWPRVSTRLGEIELEGYRVPLVTGTSDGSLAGSLTYYFNSDQRVQRIVFYGTTGDARPLVALVAQRFGLTRRPADDPGLYLYQVKRRRDKAESELRVRAAATVHAAEPYTRFEVALWLERPPE